MTEGNCIVLPFWRPSFLKRDELKTPPPCRSSPPWGTSSSLLPTHSQALDLRVCNNILIHKLGFQISKCSCIRFNLFPTCDRLASKENLHRVVKDHLDELWSLGIRSSAIHLINRNDFFCFGLLGPNKVMERNLKVQQSHGWGQVLEQLEETPRYTVAHKRMMHMCVLHQLALLSHMCSFCLEEYSVCGVSPRSTLWQETP